MAAQKEGKMAITAEVVVVLKHKLDQEKKFGKTTPSWSHHTSDDIWHRVVESFEYGKWNLLGCCKVLPDEFFDQSRWSIRPAGVFCKRCFLSGRRYVRETKRRLAIQEERLRRETESLGA